MSNGPPSKKRKATLDLTAPTESNYEDIWSTPDLSEKALTEPGTLFGSARSWFVRDSYVDLYTSIMNDTVYHTQIVNGTAGIGKSAFLLYMLARLRCAGKCALLHYHRTVHESAIAMFFPANNDDPVLSIVATHPDYRKMFKEWYRRVGEQESVFLVDGIVSFTYDDFQGVKYVTAKSPSCDIGFMEKDQNRFDRWLEFWSQQELLSYAEQVGIPDAKSIIAGNMFHLGGVCRYAFVRDAAQNAVMNAISVVGAKDLFKVVKTGLAGKYENQKAVDRLIHHHPPADKTGVYGTTFTFASEFVATRVAIVLSLEMDIATGDLLRTLQGVGAASSMRGVLFEAYAARKIAAGGSFCVNEIGSTSSEETKLDLPRTTVFQKDTKTLNKTNYPPNEIKGKLVWPNPDYHMPTIDMFMFLLQTQTCIAFQMTVAHSHGLDLKGTKAFLKYFDSVVRALFREQAVPKDYSLYFAVPTDIYDSFSNAQQPITGALGVTTNTQEATDVGARVKQWIMKIE